MSAGPDDTHTVELATVNQLPARAAARRAMAAMTPSPSAGASANLSQQFAMATLRDEEARTARAMIRAGRLMGAACLVALPLLGGSTWLRIAMAVAMLPALAAGFWVDRRIRDAERYTEDVMVLLATSVAPVALLAVLYFGIFSAAQLFPALALYFFSRRERFASALAFYLGNLVLQAAFAVAVIGRWVDDPGLVHTDLAARDLIVAHVLIQLGDLGAFLVGLRSHRAAREALERTQHAMLLAAQREALLHEARQDLDRALHVASAGRYTDQTLGAYRLGRVIGRGGMGEVYDAWHVDTGDAAAVKLLVQSEQGNPRSVERFLREVRAVRAVTSRHVVRVLAASDESDPIPYLVMERLTGHDLAHHLRAGRLPPAGLDELLAQVGEALEEAWSLGIVHRDLKPQNLYLADDAPRPIWKVLDFGVAALGDHDGTLTQGHVVGTPAYMAPEQARGERVDARADVYALTAVAYRWLTGRPAIAGRDLHTSLYQAVHVMPIRPSALAELDADVDAALAIGLAKDPAQRWAHPHELAAALRAAHAGTLDDATRDRATAVLAAHPWGAVRVLS
ncbi:MAG: serine/threonine protein kinase [Deltaproteobacteria bacterium]|nr:serine/threonine protein kinase [Deltaproteobacteria bacterium]